MKRLTLLALLSAWLALPVMAGDGTEGDPWLVRSDGSGDFTTVQLAVNAVSAGEFIEIQALTAGGTALFTESVSMAAAANVTIQGRAGDTIIIVPSGTTDTSDGNCIQYTTGDGDGLTLKRITFAGSGTSAHQGIYHNVDNTLTVVDCIFTNLRCGIFNRSGVGGPVVVTGSTFTAPQATAASGSTWAIQQFNDSLTMVSCTVDGRDTTSPTWLRAVNLRNADSSSITGSMFYGDDNEDGECIQSRNVSDLVIQFSAFEGFSSGTIQLGAAVAGEYDERVQIQSCEFYNTPSAAIQAQLPTTNDQHSMHRDFVIQGNKIYNGGVTGSSGILVTGLRGGLISQNEIHGFSAADDSAVQLTSCRFVEVSENQIFDCDNGVVIAGNNHLTNLYQYGCSIVRNFFSGDADDGAIKIDNYDGAGAAPNDSSITIAANVYANVTYVGAYVNTSDVTSYDATIGEWQSMLESVAQIRGKGVGSVQDPTANEHIARGIVDRRVLGPYPVLR